METEYGSARLADYSTDGSIERGAIDVPFLLLVLLLLTVGVIMVLSASFARAFYDVSETDGNATYYFTRQLIFAALGVGAMLLMSRFPMGFYRRFSFMVLFVAIVLLALVPLIGVNAGGARRWINLGFTTFQPSEIAKIGVIMAFSNMLCSGKRNMSSFKEGILPFVIIIGIIVGLLVLEPHLSASVIIVGIGVVMLFVGGAPLFWFVGGLIFVGAVGFVVIKFFPYASSRVATWLDPFADMVGDGYQIVQSLLAIGSGGLTGLGIGQSRQKYLYLPEEHNDFIFSVVCEELGFIGAALILALFAMLVIRGYWIAMHSRDKYSFYVCVGVTTLLAMQVILNVAVCTNLIPCTGISLPFFSYGGTALLIQMAEMGLVLSISRDIPTSK